MNYDRVNAAMSEQQPQAILRERVETMGRYASEMLQLAESIEDRLFGSRPRPATEKQASGQGGLTNELDILNSHISELGGMLSRINDRL